MFKNTDRSFAFKLKYAWDIVLCLITCVYNQTLAHNTGTPDLSNFAVLQR